MLRVAAAISIFIIVLPLLSVLVTMLSTIAITVSTNGYIHAKSLYTTEHRNNNVFMYYLSAYFTYLHTSFSSCLFYLFVVIRTCKQYAAMLPSVGADLGGPAGGLFG